MLEECNGEGVLKETERDAFTDGETLSYAEESCQNTVQSENDEVQLCWEENGFQTLLSRRIKVRQRWENYRYRCQEVQRMIGH